MAESYVELESVKLSGGEDGAGTQGEIVTMICMHVSMIIILYVLRESYTYNFNTLCMCIIIYYAYVQKYHNINFIY